MNELSCHDLEEMLAAYAADALEPDDRADVAVHLAECRNHDGILVELRQGFASLAAGMVPIQPPASLRASLLDAFEREAVTPSALEPLQSPAIATLAAPAPKRLTTAAWLGYTLAAALLVVAIGVGAWGASRGTSESGIKMLTTREGGASLLLTYLPAQGLGVLDVELPDLGDGQAYQAWRINEDGSAISLGILSTNHGRIALDGDLRGAALVALTIEPAGGSPSPTGTPFLITAVN